MFWGSFIYDFKGPYHIYYKETEEQKELNEAEMDRINEEEVEAECRVAFDAQEREKERK
jgi:predicted metal-dependent peptidase